MLSPQHSTAPTVVTAQAKRFPTDTAVRFDPVPAFVGAEAGQILTARLRSRSRRLAIPRNCSIIDAREN